MDWMRGDGRSEHGKPRLQTAFGEVLCWRRRGGVNFFFVEVENVVDMVGVGAQVENDFQRRVDDWTVDVDDELEVCWSVGGHDDDRGGEECGGSDTSRVRESMTVQWE